MSLYSNDDPISLELPVFSSNREAVIENNLVIPIPDGFHFTQDPAIIGPERALIVVPDSYPLTAPASDAPFALSVQSSPPDNSNDFKLRFMPNAADAMVNLLISPMLDPSIMTFRTGIRDGFGVFFQSFVDTGYHYNKVLAFIAADHKLYIAHLFWNNGSERCRERAFVDVFLTAATAWMEEFHLVGEPRGRKPLSAPQQNQPFFQTADPDNGLYPYYEQKRRENALQLPGGRINFVFVHGSTEDYQLVSFRARAAQEDTDLEFAKICREIGQADVERYPLYETAEKWSRLFHVRASAFDPQRDREGELRQGLMRNAYMLHALRSFAWTLGAYCRRNLVTPEMVEQETLLVLIDYAATREWLNYNSAFFCPTLCGCSDLHTMYVSEAVISEAEKQFLPSQEELEREKKIRESFPTYTPTHSEVRSLDKLRNELSYIEPAIRSLYEKLSAERNYDNELSGNAADILYAWCALAIAAKESFYIEQGEENYTFTHTSDKQFLNASPKSRKNTAKSASKKSAAPAEGESIAQTHVPPIAEAKPKPAAKKTSKKAATPKKAKSPAKPVEPLYPEDDDFDYALASSPLPKQPLYPEDYDSEMNEVNDIQPQNELPGSENYGADMLAVNQETEAEYSVDELKELREKNDKLKAAIAEQKRIIEKNDELKAAIAEQERIIQKNWGLFGNSRRRRIEAKDKLAKLQKEQAEIAEEIETQEALAEMQKSLEDMKKSMDELKSLMDSIG